LYLNVLQYNVLIVIL